MSGRGRGPRDHRSGGGQGGSHGGSQGGSHGGRGGRPGDVAGGGRGHDARAGGGHPSARDRPFRGPATGNRASPPAPPARSAPQPGPSPAEVAAALPVYEVRDSLVDAVRRHQVVVVEGPTGSGKTTQLPRILFHAGITDRTIGVTQPRRIAATSVAHRIAQEEGLEVGGLVGHSIRFDDQTSAATRIKVMTDGILLEEARHDRDFEAYGVLMVDEAHERTLNIDVTLGLLARALARRADLRVIVASATLDPGLFVRFFAHLGAEVPIIRIDSRPYPVQIEYRPVVDSGRDAHAYAVADEVERIVRAGAPGHILAFLSGEGPIQQAMAELQRRRIDRNAELLPLYGALQREEQDLVFAEFGRRKIVLATNVAETSITVPDVRFVIDTGVAKVPRFDPATGIRTLFEEPVARANCDQRAGRAGRTAPGKAIRLYAARDYERRTQFGDPEILRSDLREVALRLTDLGVDDLDEFELPTAAPRYLLREAIDWLQRMNILDERRQLTAIGKRITPFPLSPPLGLMVVRAADETPEVLDEVLVLAAFLSSRRPWQFPIGEEQEARAAQERFADPRGDILTLLHLWQAYTDAGATDDGEAKREIFCRRHYIDGGVLRFVEHAHDQLRDIAGKIGMEIGGGGRVEGVVAAFAAAFADHLLVAQGRFYLGPGDSKVAIHPASTCSGTNARFLVAGEIIVLARIYASMVAVVDANLVAKIDPALAARLRLRVQDRQKEKPAAAGPALPATLQIGPVALPIVDRRGRVQIDVPYAALAGLRGVGREDLVGVDARLLDLKARVLSGDHAFAAGTPLRLLLRLLPVLPIPAPDADLRCSVPEGVLFEADRNLHGLMRHLPALLRPMQSARGGKPGWLALVFNGQTGFWLEVMTDFGDAIESTVGALAGLSDALDDQDAEQFPLHAAQREVGALAERFQQARHPGGRRG